MALLIDASIVIVYFAGILSLGLYMGRRENSLADFALGGRRVPWWAVMASIIAAETSAATFLGAPGEGYKQQSIAYAQLVIGLIIARILVGYIFLKPYFTYKVYTVYDYLAIRFGPASKNYAAALFLILRTLASGARVFVPTIVMVLAWQLLRGGGHVDYGVANQSLWPYALCILLITVMTGLYTTVGGIKAVIWTDVVQATLMFGSAIVAILTLLYHLGGDSWNLAQGWNTLTQHVPNLHSHRGFFYFGWEDFFVADWMKTRGIDHMTPWEWFRLTLGSDYTLASALVGAIFTSLGAFGTDQDMVQRMLTAETYKKSRRSLITSAFMDLPIASCFAFIGVLLYAYYQIDPTFKPKDNADVFGSYILNVMPVGVRGLVLAGVFATAMGSLSAALNALATSATNDWYIPYFAKHKSEENHVLAARVFTIVFAGLMILIAVGSAYLKVTNPEFRILPFVLGIAGLFLGPMLGVFMIGMFTRTRGSDRGNVLAITVGLVGIILLTGQHIELLNILDPAPKGSPPKHALPSWVPLIKFTWSAMIGSLTVFFIGICFRTPPAMVESARRQAQLAGAEADVPVTLRN